MYKVTLRQRYNDIEFEFKELDYELLEFIEKSFSHGSVEAKIEEIKEETDNVGKSDENPIGTESTEGAV